ncbi:MAG TPA: cytochrome d ubiquinol oxidase subunit II [Thiohalobacter sp.]|nr:cytochrome d ubiquinol oxidase subunit II [Thiohalobacter sp.]
MVIDLALVWAGLVAFAVLAYVILDGFDLGIGVLFPWLEDRQHKDMAMNSVAPVWDGNETWLVFGGAGLFAVFPLAYATLLPALYIPIIVMLLGLIFRGVAFEFRARANTTRWLWDFGFAGGSIAAAFAQGITLGALVQGIPVEGRAYAGGSWDWLTPFSLLTGTALVIGYALLGATWLILKTEGELARFARRAAWRTGSATFVLILLVSLITPFLNPAYLHRWFAWPTLVFSFIVPALVLICGWLLYRGLRRRHEAQPFLSALGLFVLCYAGILISFYPFLVPPGITLWQAAAPQASLAFMLVGALVLLPVILTYTAYNYWVFRGKVRTGEGYH